uniref:Secreted protein n=1 Tax=Anopheles darlingi TaxID=43151 RepID=A0A2M4DRL6_ANODA
MMMMLWAAGAATATVTACPTAGCTNAIVLQPAGHEPVMGRLLWWWTPTTSRWSSFRMPMRWLSGGVMCMRVWWWYMLRMRMSMR